MKKIILLLSLLFFVSILKKMRILVDDNQKKCVCNIILKEKVSFIEVSGKKLSIDDVTVSEITKHKTPIISSALENLK